MWQHCNKVLHEAPDNWALILEVELNLHVTELYNLGPQAFTPSAALMKHTLPALLQLPKAYKAHWVEMAHIAKAKKDRTKAGPYQQEHCCMQTWLIQGQHKKEQRNYWKPSIVIQPTGADQILVWWH